ncbi:MAG: 16S rRNA (adenine(1518)-N(6)/adenine(1519)-N(6))-dimethyltransferase RsmA [Acidimicrobiales bacterium]|nr:16S rRNA (adenine(1518)-N(6)/adenine(1519)-N(6))-dimethyltransferase RsmA [Acidimicrobiaceae bacterium]MXY01500.1 16S rRNA (adenine(1518)-N(6)/adenine(1519)-N(6))-dimethyltransferase RsmA [Acidimicrobiales bacterium]MYA83008.1 16S rRNA (adenine(1518)-N(6)/adenine(1519)-N(6))-dimethyltransferase RsmA [Acidimicrobiales bacterium]MYG89838.1 16S rRNA (adenine(1518)-N(6)/adenine(1519)-N(6))-dimethyltransferase RsmA [Acidimicrobiales bacterium]MYH75068.1 16S rRNA (adenine(1518)-N(6)/adenine(1519)-
MTDRMLTLPAVKELLEQFGAAPRRSLGQNFVVDPNTVRRIARLSGVGPGDRVVEIGAGLGSLTLALAETGAEVVAVETDGRLVPLLREVVSAFLTGCDQSAAEPGAAKPNAVQIVHADARRMDWSALLPGSGWQVVANLPYNIATSLVLTVLDEVPAVNRLLVTCQREAAERLAAVPGSGAYGAVSVRVAIHADAELAGAVPASVFYPRPEVESALVRVTRRAPPMEPDLRAEVNRLVTAAFAHRRQMLRRTLRGAVDDADGTLAAAGVDPTDRPERLGLDQWIRLAEVSLEARARG